MYMIAEVSQYVAVASFAEAWIEIIPKTSYSSSSEVASFAEAWIEICRRELKNTHPGRLLRGGVD